MTAPGDPVDRPRPPAAATLGDGSTRWTRGLRRALPRAWRTWLFDPSVVELEESEIVAREAAPTAPSASGRAARWLRLHARLTRIWLQCWRAGLAGALRERARRLRSAFSSRPRPVHARARRRADLPAVPDPESPMSSMLQDLRYAARGLRASPGFTLVAVLTLALGTGANTAIFSIVDVMMLRPLPQVQNGEELAFVMAKVPDTSFFMGLSYPNYEDVQARAATLEDALAYSFQTISLTTADGLAERTFAHSVSANYFDVLGVRLARGRGFLPEEGLLDSPAAVLVVDHDFWQSRLGGDPDVVGSTVQVNGVAFTIVGVTPEGFLGVETMLGTQIYLPVGALPAISPSNASFLQSRRTNAFRVLGRLAAGVDLQQARADIETIGAQLRAAYPDDNRDEMLAIFPERAARPDPSVGVQFGGVAAIFAVLVTLVLMIACANVANLLLARASGRTREMAVRSALGAGRLRVMRQLASESLLLGVAGGAVGVLIAAWATATLRAVVASWQVEISIRLPLTLDLRMLAFAIGIAVAAGVLAGVLPALRATSGNVTEGLNEGTRGASAGAARQRLRGALVVTQVAVSVVLLIAAGLFVRSLANARNAALGFESDNRLLVSFDPSVVSMPAAETAALYRDVLERTRALPGVIAAGLTGAPIFSPRTSFSEILTEERAAAGNERGTLTPFFRVSPGYLEAAGTQLLRGRDLNAADTADTPRVALVNEAMAARMWPGEDPLAQRFVTGGGLTFEVVGVVEQGKYMLVWEEPSPAFFAHAQQLMPPTASLVVHTDGNELGLVDPIRRLLSELAPTVPVFGVLTVHDHLRDGRALMLVRLGSGLVAAFGILGMALATIGLYGVIAYTVNQRLREFGVRIALGAEPRRVVSMVVRNGMILALVGGGLGLLLAIGVGRLVGSLLIDTSPTDPLTFGAGIALVLVTAIAASLVPAWRATRVDPMVALREE